MHRILTVINEITMADQSAPIVPFPIDELIYPFEYDYYMYLGSVLNETTSPYVILWCICRDITNLSFEQVNVNTLYLLNLFYAKVVYQIIPPNILTQCQYIIFFVFYIWKNIQRSLFNELLNGSTFTKKLKWAFANNIINKDKEIFFFSCCYFDIFKIIVWYQFTIITVKLNRLMKIK